MAELVLLWMILVYGLGRSAGTPPPWHASATALLPWLLIRWPLLNPVPVRSPLLACLRWVQVNTGGLALGFATLSIFYSVPLRALVPLAGFCLILLAAFSCLTVEPLRDRIERKTTELWAAWGTSSGEALAPLLAIWLWDRLVLPATLPVESYLWLTVAAGISAWTIRRIKTAWRCLLPALVLTVPLFLAFDGTPDGRADERFVVLAVFTASAALVHGIFAPLFGVLGSERARLWVLGLAALWLAEPLLTLQSNGSGDSQWYSLVMADAIAQWRAGFFPPLIGRSEYAFSGSSFPGNFAPYYQCFGVLLNLLTGDVLNPFAIKNLTVSLSLVGGALAAFYTLSALAPGNRNRAAALALLYIASPAWLGALYSMDMYMTMMTLPWLPPIFAGCIRSFSRLDVRALLWVTVPLSIVWHAHPPVALWSTIAVAIIQAVRLVTHRHGWIREGLCFASGIVGFALLTCLPFSTAFYSTRTTDEFRYAYVLETLATHWDQAWFPVSNGAALLTDQNLGWSLALIALAGGVCAIRGRLLPTGSLMIAGGAVLLLLIPVPWLQSALWHGLPEEIKAITNNWPTQRLYPVLAALVVVGCGTAFLTTFRRRAHLPTWALTGLAFALAWSFAEASKFQNRGRETTVSVEDSDKQLLPENIKVTRYAYEMFEQKPEYISHGFMNPVMKNWLVDRQSLRVFESNRNSVRRSEPVRELILRRQPGGRREVYEFAPAITLEPGRQYLLEFRFGGRSLQGELTLRGQRLDRSYSLPNSGPKIAAFGSAAGQENSLSVWTSGQDRETFRLSFRPSTAEIPAILARVRVFEIDPNLLPVKVHSVMPYRSSVRSSRPAWLVTHRMFLPGYRATVNGQPAEVRKSPEGLVMVEVPKGSAELELRYVGPWPVRLALWVTGITWAVLLLTALGLLVARNINKHRHSRPKFSHSLKPVAGLGS